MVVQQEKFWVCGESREDSFVDLFKDGKRKKTHDLGQGIYISAMEVSNDNIFVTGRRVEDNKKEEMENYFLLC